MSEKSPSRRLRSEASLGRAHEGATGVTRPSGLFSDGAYSRILWGAVALQGPTQLIVSES